MRRTPVILRLLCFTLVWPLSLNAADYAEVTEDGRGAVATVQPRATEAALAAYDEGGNAVDAAVAAALTLGVVDGHNSGIGGGLFALVHWADGSVEAIDGREMAPDAARRDMFLRGGEYRPELSKQGPLAVGIPGSVAAFDYMIERGGEAPLARHLNRAADLAEQGFAIDGIFSRRLQRHAEDLKATPGSAARIFLDAEGQAWPAGHRLRQPELARTYRTIAEYGPDYFYGGGFAFAVGEWMTEHSGMVSAEDFKEYELEIREPVVSDYRGYRLYGFPPPSSGGVHVAQILNMLAGIEPAKLAEADRYHWLAETMRLAFADRAHWLGDSDYVDVPRGLIHPDYARRLRQRIDPEQVNRVDGHSTPPAAEESLFGHTTHIATADAEGNWVAITATVNTNFGSKVVVPGTGVVLNNQMDDFSAQPGEPNAYGLIGAEANSIQSGKRPLSSMSPTILTREGKPVLTLGAAGGPTIITQVAQTLVNHIDLELGLRDAMAMPRVHHQWRPNRLFVEKTLPGAVREALEAKGHETREMGDYGSTQAIGLDRHGNFVPVAEPRLERRNRLD